MTTPSASPPSTVTVRSPEGVELELRPATPAPRIVAYAVDSALLSLILLVAFVLLLSGSSFVEGMVEKVRDMAPQEGKQSDEAAAALAPFVVVFLVALYFGELVYFFVMELAFKGQSLGKKLMKLRVVRDDGGPLTPQTIGIRNLLRLADMLPAGYVVGLTSMVVSPLGRRLGDIVAGTLVVRTDTAERPSEVWLPPDLEPLALSRDQLGRLGRRELQLARNTLRRLEERSADTQGPSGHSLPFQELPLRYQELVEQVALALAQALQFPLPSGTDPQRFLQQVVLTAQRNRAKGAGR